MSSMTTSSEFVEVHAVRVALFYDYMPPADKSQFDIYIPVQSDGKVRFISGEKKQEAAFRQLANKVKQACEPEVFLFSVPYNDQSGTLDYIFYETYIGAHSTPIDLDCIRQFATTLKEEKPEGLAFRMIDGEGVQTFMLPAGMWKEITNIPTNIKKGRPRWFVFPEHGGIRQPNNLLPLTSYKLKGQRVAWWKSDERVNIQFDSELKWVQVNDERHGVPVFAYGEKSYEEAAHAVCIDNAYHPVSVADDDLVTAFGNLRFLATAHTVSTSDVLEAVAKEAPAARASSKKRVRSSSDGFDMAFMSRIVHKLTLDRLDDDEKLKTERNVTLALPQQYLSIENDISARVFDVAKVRLQKGLSTYILVPVLNKSSWVVAGLYISSTQALRLHGNPIWTMDDDKNSGVVDTLYTTFTTIMPAFGGTVPPLKREVVDFSCSMYFVPKDSQASTGTSVVAMLMSQIGLLTPDGSGYANLPFACDYCEKKSERLKSKLDAFAANAPDLSSPANNDGDDHDDRHDGGGDDLDGDDDDGDGKQSPVKKRAAGQRAAKSGAGVVVHEAEPDDAGGVGFSRNIGLQNTGVTCYMNAVLIGLFKILPIRDFLGGLNDAVKSGPGREDIRTAIHNLALSTQLVEEPEENDGLSSDAKNVVVACMWFRACDAVFTQYHSDVTGPPIATIPLVNAFRTLDWYYSTLMEGQQDASEFLNACLDKLLFFSLQWSNDNHVPGVNSRLSNAYTTVVQTTINVPEGHAVSSAEHCVNTGERNNVVRYGKLDVPLHQDDGIYVPISDQIQQLLFNTEDVDYRCDTCIPDPKERERSDAFTCKQTTRATFVPEYVIASLNRFQTDPITHRRKKIVGTVKPDADGNVRIYKDGRPIAYEILCALKHRGNLEGGHYYAITKEGIHKYVKFDDSRVTDMSEDGANKILETAYVYILKRVDDGALFGGAGGPANGVGAGAAVGFDGGRGRGRQRLSRLHRYASLD